MVRVDSAEANHPELRVSGAVGMIPRLRQLVLQRRTSKLC